MPFTPFHMGAALIVKPAAAARFSVVTFGFAQVLMDIEPGVGMIVGSDVLHGPTHTILGAILIAAVTALITSLPRRLIVEGLNGLVRTHGGAWMCEPEQTSAGVVWVSALFGTLSHVFLDSLMHHDIRPFAPFSNANPFLGLVSHDGVYWLCLAMGIAGAVGWAVRKRAAAAGNETPPATH